MVVEEQLQFEAAVLVEVVERSQLLRSFASRLRMLDTRRRKHLDTPLLSRPAR